MAVKDVELSCDACGISTVVHVGELNSYGITARPAGWTHSGRGMAVIGAKDWCPSCSPRLGGTPWPAESFVASPSVLGLLAALSQEDFAQL